MSELLTPQEITAIERKFFADGFGKDAPSLVILIAQAQLAKCKEHYEKELEFYKHYVPTPVSKDIMAQFTHHVETVIIPARIAEAEKKLIEWLDEPCSAHPWKDRELISGSDRITHEVERYYCHRRDCPKCMQELKEVKP